MPHLAISINGAIMLLYRLACMFSTLLGPEKDHLWTPVLAVMFLLIFHETALHVLLLVSLWLERRWRFAITMWLYQVFRLAILHTLMAAVAVYMGTGADAPGTQKHLVALVALLWITWFATYQYVEADQKGRDNQRQADQLAGHEAAPGGAPDGLVANDDPADRVPNRGQAGQVPNRLPNEAPAGQIQAGLDPTDIYMLVPSHTEPRLPFVPSWEQDLDSWRFMAMISHYTTTVFYAAVMLIPTIAGLRNRAEM